MAENDKSKQHEQPALIINAHLMRYVLVASVFFAVGIAVGALMFGRNNGVDAPTIERIMRDVLADADIPTSVDRFALVDDDPYIGNINAPIVIVEFSAYGCPYCKQHYDTTLQPLLDAYGEYIRYVFRDMPTTAPEVSFPAAMAADCANDQGKYWAYHDALFENQASLNNDFFVLLANTLELNLEEFETCLTENKYYDEVNRDFFDGSMQDVTGTPTFFINGEKYSGAQPYAFFENIVLAELAKAGITPKS